MLTEYHRITEILGAMKEAVKKGDPVLQLTVRELLEGIQNLIEENLHADKDARTRVEAAWDRLE